MLIEQECTTVRINSSLVSEEVVEETQLTNSETALTEHNKEHDAVVEEANTVLQLMACKGNWSDQIENDDLEENEIENDNEGPWYLNEERSCSTR
ncbi:hypothetical protein FRX31_009043 [Thalictrum thalictroides]|uniref:Uncharacterized protein n=1 Tax=Thalictrum thalictroides TaxID=46969 RepID=A0A7J6WY18_THATH|nr:hypothetical protein FRX31_009043 [Thalictrum thalictroides]